MLPQIKQGRVQYRFAAVSRVHEAETVAGYPPVYLIRQGLHYVACGAAFDYTFTVNSIIVVISVKTAFNFRDDIL